MKPKFIQTSVHDRDGRPVPATLIQCGRCKGITFNVFTIKGHHGEHSHLQCARCSTTYCDGACRHDPGVNPGPDN